MEKYARIEEGLEFQDFASDILYHKLGFPICAYSSKKYNVNIGESIAGVEIKLDKRCTETGNLFIETFEKDKNGNWRKSGINRQDNSIFYFIGNYEVAYLLVKKQLLWLCNSRIRQETNTENTKGFLLPIEEIEGANIPLLIWKYQRRKK